MSKQVANVQLMQKMNRLKVLDFVRKNPDCSRPIISKRTGLSLASITNITSYLLEIGILSECGTENVERVGRKSTLLRFCSDAYNLICVVLGETQINVALTNLEGKVSKMLKCDTCDMQPGEVMELVRTRVNELVAQYGKQTILGVGIAISGLVLENSRFILSAQLKWKSVDIKKMLEEETGLPVFVNNISFLRAVSWFCVKKSYEDGNMLFVDMENGIGAVQFFEGTISRGTLGEIGHTTVKSDGVPCFCENRGCLEAMCSPKRLLSLYESSSGKRLSSLKELEHLVNDNDASAQFSIEECGKYLGIGLANLINLFNPSAMVINTGDFSDCPSLLVRAQKELDARAYLSLTEKLIVEKVSVSREDTICGAAYNLCDRLFDISFPDNII